MVRVLIIFLVIQYGTYLEEKFDALEYENAVLRTALRESLEMEYFSLSYKKRTDIEEFRFREIQKWLTELKLDRQMVEK